VKVCVAYEIDGERVERLPDHQSALHRATPVYEDLPGWDADTSTATEDRDLPAAAHDYLAALEDLVRVPIRLVGVGPGREQVVVRPARATAR
jgi:adenylosuccinate synthase